MAVQSNNPFVLPGMGQGGDAGQNPLLASMEMMRQAWQSLGGAANLGPATLLAPTSIEELDRRVADLRAVENWLRMNLSMLSSTIQGLEVQRATVATLKSFMASSGKQASADQPWWSPSAPDAKAPAAAAAETPKEAVEAAAAASRKSDPSKDAENTMQAGLAGAQAATQDWWNMLQKQFDSLAAATAATMQPGAADAAAKPAAAPAAPAARGSATAKKAAATAPVRKRKSTAPKKTS